MNETDRRHALITGIAVAILSGWLAYALDLRGQMVIWIVVAIIGIGVATVTAVTMSNQRRIGLLGAIGMIAGVLAIVAGTSGMHTLWAQDAYTAPHDSGTHKDPASTQAPSSTSPTPTVTVTVAPTPTPAPTTSAAPTSHGEKKVVVNPTTSGVGEGNGWTDPVDTGSTNTICFKMPDAAKNFIYAKVDGGAAQQVTWCVSGRSVTLQDRGNDGYEVTVIW